MSTSRPAPPADGTPDPRWVARCTLHTTHLAGCRAQFSFAPAVPSRRNTGAVAATLAATLAWVWLIEYASGDDGAIAIWIAHVNGVVSVALGLLLAYGLAVRHEHAGYATRPYTGPVGAAEQVRARVARSHELLADRAELLEALTARGQKDLADTVRAQAWPVALHRQALVMSRYLDDVEALRRRHPPDPDEIAGLEARGRALAGSDWGEAAAWPQSRDAVWAASDARAPGLPGRSRAA